MIITIFIKMNSATSECESQENKYVKLKNLQKFHLTL